MTRSRAQMRAMFASMAARAGGSARHILGPRAIDRRQLAKRLLLGGAVTGAAYGTALAARRLSAALGRLATKIGLAGVGGSLAAAATTIRENMAEGRARARRHAATVAEMGRRNLRTIPIEALVAKGVDKTFGAGESFLHRTAAHHLGKIAEIAGAQLGGAQFAVTERLTKRARNAHRGLGLPQPRTEDEPIMDAWANVMETPNFASLSRARSLRRDFLLKKADLNAKRLWNELSKRGEAQNLLLWGQLNPNTISQFSKEHNVDQREMQATLLRLRQIGHAAGGY